MSVAFTLDGTALAPDYDEVEDILYLWVNGGPEPAVTFESSEGHLVQLHPETRELVGVAIIDYRARWQGKSVTLEIPRFEQRVLELA